MTDGLMNRDIADSDGLVVDQDVMVPMSDGVKLSMYLYFPPGQGPWPVLYEQRYSDITVPSSRRNYAALAMRGGGFAESGNVVAIFAVDFGT